MHDGNPICCFFSALLETMTQGISNFDSKHTWALQVYQGCGAAMSKSNISNTLNTQIREIWGISFLWWINLPSYTKVFARSSSTVASAYSWITTVLPVSVLIWTQICTPSIAFSMSRLIPISNFMPSLRASSSSTTSFVSLYSSIWARRGTLHSAPGSEKACVGGVDELCCTSAANHICSETSS